MGFQLSTDQGQHTILVSEIASGSAEQLLQLFQDVLGEINAIGERIGNTGAGEKLLSSQANTMTDRAAVNSKKIQRTSRCLPTERTCT